MNIYKQELKSCLKTFILWTIVLGVLVIAGMTKFLGFQESSSSDMLVILNYIPKVIMVAFGMSEVNIMTPGGYYSVLQFYVIIITIIFAIKLGTNSVARESIDETYEFIFTKPCSRSFILAFKIIAASTYLFAFFILNFIFSIIAFNIFNINNTIIKEMLLFSISNALIGIMFFAISIFLSALIKNVDRGTSISYNLFFITYIASVLYDVFEWPKQVAKLIPLRYFTAVDILSRNFDISSVIVCILISIIALILAFICFEKRDLNAV